jgi:hypothetical protein
MEELNELELALLERLTVKYPDLTSHIAHLRVNKREKSGFSLYVYFTYQDFHQEPEMINALFSNGDKIALPELREGLSYVIDVTAGMIEHLEFSSYKENWDGKIDEYRIVAGENYE